MDAVEKGAALLDKKRPAWFQRVNLDELDMQNACHCVLGQVYEDKVDEQTGTGYEYAVTALLRGEYDQAEEYGFCKRYRGSWTSLGRRWRAEIRKRLSAA